MTEQLSHEIYLLTGERGSGKSTICARLAEWARQSGYAVNGLLTMRASDIQSEDADSVGTDRRVVVDLSTGTHFAFGCRGDSNALLPGWELDGAAFTRGNEILAVATPCDLLIVDEVGPLELLDGQGWTQAFSTLGSRDYGAALVVCRPHLVDRLLGRLGDPVPKVFCATTESRGLLPGMIAGEMEKGL